MNYMIVNIYIYIYMIVYKILYIIIIILIIYLNIKHRDGFYTKNEKKELIEQFNKATALKLEINNFK